MLKKGAIFNLPALAHCFASNSPGHGNLPNCLRAILSGILSFPGARSRRSEYSHHGSFCARLSVADGSSPNAC